ncbi:MAG: tetratricopeptide repeat protein [Symploca sp. SIO2G7]|nr:tetratricopeptide repeat protein [Symploca sp. SIO2G7]
MSSQQLEEALLDYQEKLQTIEKIVNQDHSLPSKEEIFALLTARDIILVLLVDSTQKILENPYLLVDLDSRLEKLSGIINKVIDLPQSRKSFHPNRKAWWWWLSFAMEPSRSWWDKYDKLWNFLSILFLGISLVLMFYVTTGFLSGERDAIAAIVVTVQTACATAIGGVIFTEEGIKILDKVFNYLNIPVNFRQESRLITSFTLCVTLLLVLISFPKISEFYNNQGLNHYQKGALVSAQRSYERAIALNQDYAEARYHLGLVLEDLSQEDLAIQEYSIAGINGMITANNNLARLYIKNDKNTEAVAILLKNLDKIHQEEASGSEPEQTQLKYSLLKNLGWARLNQARYEEAKVSLETAIDLDQGSAPAYCLLGQVLEKEIELNPGEDSSSKIQQIITPFENCIKYASPLDIDQDMWLGIARKKINQYTKQSNE